MILYHGSDIEIRKPDIFHSRKNLDFGCGFYVTPLYQQAEKWCEKFIRRGKEGIISQYVLDDSILENGKILKFDSYSEEWLNFIMNSRTGTDTIKYEKPNYQVCFKKQDIMDRYLHFERSVRL